MCVRGSGGGGVWHRPLICRLAGYGGKHQTCASSVMFTRLFLNPPLSLFKKGRKEERYIGQINYDPETWDQIIGSD